MDLLGFSISMISKLEVDLFHLNPWRFWLHEKSMAEMTITRRTGYKVFLPVFNKSPVLDKLLEFEYTPFSRGRPYENSESYKI